MNEQVSHSGHCILLFLIKKLDTHWVHAGGRGVAGGAHVAHGHSGGQAGNLTAWLAQVIREMEAAGAYTALTAALDSVLVRRMK